MAKHYKEDIDRYFDYSCYAPARYLHLGSIRAGDAEYDGWESGTDTEMAEYLIKGITYLESVSKKPIVIYANNLGGDWYHGMAIYDIIRASKCHITMVALGNAMSMGSIILQAADTRIISPHCVFMIHVGTEELHGHTNNVQRWAEQIPIQKRKMYEIYKERMKAQNPKITIKQIEKLCDFDTIYNAHQAVELGFADWVLEDMGEINRYFATDNAGKWTPAEPTGKHKIDEEE